MKKEAVEPIYDAKVEPNNWRKNLPKSEIGTVQMVFYAIENLLNWLDLPWKGPRFFYMKKVYFVIESQSPSIIFILD